MDGKQGAPLMTGAGYQVLESNLNRLPYEVQRTKQAERGLVTQMLLKTNRSAFGNLFLGMSRPQVCLFTNYTTIHGVLVGDFFMTYLSNLN